MKTININKTILSASISAALAVSSVMPFAAQAQYYASTPATTPTPTPTMTVTPVTATVSNVSMSPTISGSFCYYFSTNIGLNGPISAADASALQQVLVAQGLWNPSNQITAYNRPVSIAVAALQEKYASSILAPNGLTQGTGYFGNSTRAVLNQIYNCPNGTASTGMVTVNNQTFSCPVGWTCVPPSTVLTPVLCPAGWTCTPPALTTTGFVVPTSTVTVPPNLQVNPNSFFTLASSPTISSQNLTAGGATTTTIKYTATFNVNVDAVTSGLTLGLPNTANPAFENNSTSFVVYKNGAPDTTTNYQAIVSYSQPSNTTITPDGQSILVSQGQTVTIPVTYTFIVNGVSANNYAVQLQGIYSSLGLINSMMNQPAWRTQAI